ncbi:IclR family transcriptional regulator [Cupriavidus metallidurans]|uniref:IclR family transcriptional regulator n=1 Tax=Cupriavidus metallidurans TaxID=119219 RepID=UPI000B050D53|nr:helix-turn-helix domain-containing protein [Cupriavidus metallidurans]
MLEPTHESEPFSRTTPGSQTLLRGLNLLRAFVSGAPVLSNAQLAERSGLPRPTVSRLTHSLVEGGYLEYDGVSKGYRLAPVCLSLARSFHIGRSELDAVLPLMGQVATAEQINVTLSAADGFWMVYLHTIRKGRGLMSRAAMTGTRFGMVRSSTGHAYLAGLPESRRQLLMGRLASEPLRREVAEVQGAHRHIEGEVREGRLLPLARRARHGGHRDGSDGPGWCALYPECLVRGRGR